MEHIWLPPDQRKHNPWSGSSPERRKRGESSQYDDEKYYRNRVLEELNKGQRVPEACNRCKVCTRFFIYTSIYESKHQKKNWTNADAFQRQEN